MKGTRFLARGKDKNNDEWVSGLLLFDESYGLGTPVIARRGERLSEHDWSINCHSVYLFTVCQFTGVKDKNDNPIFEGDIVKTKYGRLCSVVWLSSPTYACWDMEPYGRLDCAPPDKSDLWLSKNLKVVGNIYDNPELKEVKK